MRKLSLDQVYGCSTAHRHSIIGLPDNRVAFLAGSYLVILDCITNEKRYLSFSAIEFLYISASGLLMSIIDRFTQDGDTHIHIYSTKPIDLLYIIEPDRFGNFIGITINNNDNILMILHDEPAYMITIQEIQIEFDEQHKLNMIDLASVRVVHGSVINRMTKKEILPHVEFISFCPYSFNLFCATGSALFKLYEIENQNVKQQIIHFRAEFYGFTCHCWLDINSILTATDHGHIFWIQDGSIRSDINLEESITVDLNFLKTNISNPPSITSTINSLENDPIQMFKDDLSTSNSNINLNNLPIIPEKQTDIHLSKTNKISEEIFLYLDLFTSNQISPYFIVSFREYILVFTPIIDEPFFQINARYCLQKTKEYQLDSEIHNIHKMSYIFDKNSSLIYLLTDRNQIFRYQIYQLNNSKIEFNEKHIYGFHAYNILSIGLCDHKSWLITLGSDNWIRIFDYKDNNREIISKYIPDGAYAITNSDPYGFHLCLAMNNCCHLYLITNYELRLIYQYETRHIQNIEMSHSGHLIAIITNNLIKIYSIIHLNLISQLRGHIGKIKQIIWCKNDSILISCGTDGMIYIFNIFTGMRENEIITKQFRYIGIAVTNDCNRIYAITSDSSIKIFNQINLEQEWSIEKNFIPSAICLSKSERLLYIGMTHGIIRVYTLPLTSNNYIDIPAHCSSIRRLLISYDDQYLVSIGESAYVLLFKQTKNISSQLSIEIVNEQEKMKTMFEYILVTKSEFDEQKRKIKEIQARINEFETENNLKFRSKQITFSKHLNNYSNKFQITMKQLIHTYRQLKSEIENEKSYFSNQTNQIQQKYDQLQNHTEIIYENQMIETLSRIQNTQIELEKSQIEYQNKLNDFNNKEHIDLTEIIDQINLILQSKYRSAIYDYEIIQEKERQLNEYIRQMEKDTDDEIENVKINYENELKFLNQYSKQLTINVSTLRKRYNSIIGRMESRDIERNDIEKEVKELHNRQSELIEKLDHFRLIIKKKEDRIGIHDIKLHRLQQQILHVEKRKYVLDYKTKSLLERIEPIDQEIIKLKTNNQNIEQQLTILKQQQNNLILQENEYEIKLNQSSKQLNLAKINHQQIWKIVKRQKEAIKKAFEYTEISCTSDTINSMNDQREQFKKFIQNICNTMQNEQQTENQLEIQGFMKEWNNQRKWLLNQLHNLTAHTEKNKQSYANIQREHRKAIAPFINQLRDLHNLFDNLQKKIQKRLLILKIKTNEQTEFLQNIFDILHKNEKFHLIINKLNENEFYIEIQDKEIEHLSSIIFRYQYSTPCLESNQIKLNENNITRATTPFLSNDDRLLPSSSSQPTLLTVTPDKRNPVMTTTTKNISSNSSGYVSSKPSKSEPKCNICKRLLYSFEEILRCHVCHGSYHWRCVKPETISQYGENENYICDKCNDSTTIINSSHRLSNGSNRTNSIESIDTNYRDLVSVPSETNVGNSIRHFEENQQQFQPHKTTPQVSDLDDYLPAQMNGNEYHHQNSQYNDDSRTTQRIQQQQNGIESDEEHDRTTMFQANYEYTPLKEYAATRNNRTINDNITNNYQNSSADNTDRQPTSRYGGGLHYTNHGYDPTITRLVEAPSIGTTNITSPTVDNLSIHNRRHHFISTTNLSINEKPSRRPQQQNSLVNSSPYLSQNHDNDSSTFKSSSQQQHQTDHHSTVGNDSGIVNANSNSQQQQHSDENHLVEKKLTNLVQQLGKQLENDAQKLNDKLEIKLKELENMIHQQTFVIRRQDEVIERLKNQILQIETERDHFRNRLSVHEQREQDEKKKITINEKQRFNKQPNINEQDNQTKRTYSNTSTVITDNNKQLTKKPAAPRFDHQWSTKNNEHEPAIAKLVKNVPINRERLESDSSSVPSITGKLASSVPVIETPAASSRLDNIIHQLNTKDVINPSSSNYSLAQVRHQDRPQILEPVSMEQHQIVTTVHHEDNDNDNNKKPVLKKIRSSSTSSSSSSNLPAQPVKPTNTTTTANRNPNKYSSFESLQPAYLNEQGSKLTNKTASLQFGTKPVQDDDPRSIYITPVQVNHPAIQYNSSVKGWLRKQNRDSFLKRIERYYCVLANNALLMHRHDHDTTPYKAINLKGAKILYYDDPKYGPSLELTWSNLLNDPKHYHLYAPNPQEAEQWLTGIQKAIDNLGNKNKWQRYRINT